MRKLTLCAAGFALSLVLANYLIPAGWLLPAAGGAIALAALALLLRRERLRRSLLIGLLAAAVGFGWFWGYGELVFSRAEALAGERRTVAARVIEYPDVAEDYSSVVVRVTDPALPRVKLLVYDYAAGMGELRPGDTVELPLKLKSAGVRYGLETDYYRAKNIALRATLDGDCTVTGRVRWAWLYFPQTLARAVGAQALESFPDDVAPLMKAILTGDRTEYYQDDALCTAMSTAGFVHIVAVSGMHVGFLAAMLRMLTGRRRISAFLGIPTIVVFMAMAGFTPSVVRAGFMQIVLLLAPLLRRENDALTSLSGALLLLLLLNPAAIASVSLQLSFAAMLGLVLLTPKIYELLTRDAAGKWRLPAASRGRGLKLLCSALAASLGATVFSTPLAAIHFGYMPLYAVLTNLLCLWAMSTAFMAGYYVCLLGLLWAPLGLAAGWVVGWLPRYTIAVVKLIAKLPMAAVFTRSGPGGWWLLGVYIVFAVFVIRSRGGRFRPILPTCIALSSLIIITFFTYRPPETGVLELAAIDVGQGQSIAAMTDTGTVLIDCGGIGEGNAGDAAAEFLLQNGIERVDALLITHFHADHVNGVERLLARLDVEQLVYAAGCEQTGYMDDILDACADAGVTTYVIDRDTVLALGSLELTLFAPAAVGGVNERCMMVYGDWGDYEFLVTGDAPASVERALIESHDLGDMELLVVGHHGSRYSTDEALLDDITPETALISVGAGNTYGHPTQEVLDRLEERGIEVRRTDESGTIIIKVEK